MTYENDIPLSIALNAHRGTSFVPKQRAESVRNDYASTLQTDYDNLKKLADTPEKESALANEFARYREGYKTKTIAWLQSRSRMVSVMIAGPSNFPSRRQEKINNTEHNRLTELIEFRKRALEAIRKKLCPELRPIMSGDADAIGRLQEKIAEAERMQNRMKRINSIHKKYLKNPASLDKETDLAEKDKQLIRSYIPQYSWEPHPFPPYAMTNNNANIRRMKERLEQLEKAKATPETETQGKNARIEDSPTDNRVRLFFPGKPDESVRNKMKSSGFRWTPSLGCWQAYRSHRSLELAKEIAG